MKRNIEYEAGVKFQKHQCSRSIKVDEIGISIARSMGEPEEKLILFLKHFSVPRTRVCAMKDGGWKIRKYFFMQKIKF